MKEATDFLLSLNGWQWFGVICLTCVALSGVAQIVRALLDPLDKY